MGIGIRGRLGWGRPCARSWRKSSSGSTTNDSSFVTVTSVEVDNELNRAHVYFDSLAGEDSDDEIVEALDRHRSRLQSSIAKQIRAKKTPILDFRPDIALRSAERIDDILREDRHRRGEA